jgi:glycogen phosphorylase/synthase
MKENTIMPDYLFEVSWEVCNKIGGIHTAISTKASILSTQFNDNYICIGPDVWKETHGNPEFIEDKFLFRSWREQAGSDGIHIRIGRWKVHGEPIAMLVDFTPLFGDKDKIFTDFWLKFKLNSLGGQWDYTEPAMFGYAAGQLIEHFYDYHMSSNERLIAHFHEWMTGTGVLYLRDRVPQAGTVFTTHATTIGRTLANQGKPFYSILDTINPETTAKELGIVSRHSLEQVAALNADTFTTVSSEMIKECKLLLGKEPNIITPNGFAPGFVPGINEFAAKRKAARKQLINIASGVLNQRLPDNSILIGLSGRYEYQNKGMDLFIDALSELSQRKPDNTVIAFLLVPANHTGVRSEVIKRIQQPDFSSPLSDEYITHMMVDEGYDPILRQLKKVDLHNYSDDKVKVLFIPAYLNGSDEALGLDYYDTLTGFDLTVFPSYYEPWGYTPLESMAFHIPTITTLQSGFAHWIKNNFEKTEKAISFIDRTDNDHKQLVQSLVAVLHEMIGEKGAGTLTGLGEGYNALSHINMLDSRNLAGEIAQSATWDYFIEKYYDAYEAALHRASERYELYKEKQPPAKVIELPPPASMVPVWKKINVEINMPEAFKMLPSLVKNLWWTWNYEAADLFRDIDAELWEKCEKNPNILLENLSIEDFDRLLNDQTHL